MRILLIEDDPGTRANLTDLLELDGHHAESAESFAIALADRDWSLISVILLDWNLPDGSAGEMLPRLRELAPDADIIISTGAIGMSGAVTALRHGAADYIVKPINPDTFRASLARIAERRRLAEEKERSRAAFRSLVRAAPCLIFLLNQEDKVVYLSPFAEELTGYHADELRERELRSLFPGIVQAASGGVFRGGERGHELTLLRKDGSLLNVAWSTVPIEHEGAPALLAIGQDITRLKQAEAQRVQAARLATLGQMMTSIAHESGNALARSQHCLEMLVQELEGHEEALLLLHRAQRAQDDLQRLYGELRDYAAPWKLDCEHWDLQRAWRQAYHHLQGQHGEKIAPLKEVLSVEDPTLLFDVFRITQVFRCVLENSLAVTPHEGEIRIICEEAEVQGCPAIRARILDQGPGLTPDQILHLFEPFFTTKSKGVGLGMAIAKRIVDAHGGTIAATNAPKGGAEIAITLPRTPLPSEPPLC